ncbi:MAG: hypothetical protein LQ347_004818 [Umbilicaria vellea]|nr:MAG: hypothetical protein LQ347_004818 [Umbilicaria vellea]
MASLDEVKPSMGLALLDGIGPLDDTVPLRDVKSLDVVEPEGAEPLNKVELMDNSELIDEVEALAEAEPIAENDESPTIVEGTPLSTVVIEDGSLLTMIGELIDPDELSPPNPEALLSTVVDCPLAVTERLSEPDEAWEPFV